MTDYEKWLNGLIKVTPVLVFIIFWKRFISGLAWIKDGVSKREFAALIFLAILIWMYWRDGHREHEWSFFTDMQYIVSYIFISVGLGLNEILEAIYAIKGMKRNETTENS